MDGLWLRINHFLDHPGVRIGDGRLDRRISLVPLAALVADLERARGAPVPPPARGGDGLPAALAIELCNKLHQLSRSVEKAREQGSAEADRLKNHVARLARTLREQSVEWEDLTGQAYDPGRADFEQLGEPQERPELNGKTIIQCERPVVRIMGRPVQAARGIVGVPIT